MCSTKYFTKSKNNQFEESLLQCHVFPAYCTFQIQHAFNDNQSHDLIVLPVFYISDSEAEVSVEKTNDDSMAVD